MYTRKVYPNVTTVGPYAIDLSYLSAAHLKAYLVDADGFTNPVAVPFTFAGTPSDLQPAGTSIVLTAPPDGRYLLIVNEASLWQLFVPWNVSSALSWRNLNHTSRDLLEKIWVLADRVEQVEYLSLETLEQIYNILPETVLAAAAQIQADRILAQQAAQEAQAVKVNFERYVDLDFGAGKQYLETVIPYPDIPAGTLVRLQQTGIGVGRPDDENAMDFIVCNVAVFEDNLLTINARSLDGAAHGVYRFALIA